MKDNRPYRWSGNRWAKVLAVLLFIVTCFTTVFGAVGFLALESYDIYRNTKGEVLNQWYQDAMDTYSVGAIAYRDKDYNYGELQKTNFRYGVIKSDVFNEQMILVPDNYDFLAFDESFEKMEISDFHIYSCWFNADSGYRYDPTVFSSSWIGSYEGMDWVYRPIEGIYYDWQSGLLYLSDGINLVLYDNEIYIRLDDGEIEYLTASELRDYVVTGTANAKSGEDNSAEFAEKSEEPETAEAETSKTETDKTETDKTETDKTETVETETVKTETAKTESSKTEADKQTAAQTESEPEPTMEEDAVKSQSDAGAFLSIPRSVDGRIYLSSNDYAIDLEDVMPVKTKELQNYGEVQTSGFRYELSLGKIGVPEKTDFSKDTYYVISYCANPVTKGATYQSSDLFAQYQMILDFIYQIRDLAIPMFAVSVILCFLSLGFLFFGTGRKSGESGLYESVLYRIPWDISMVCSLAADLGLLCLIVIGLEECMNGSSFACFLRPLPWILIFVPGTIGILLTLAACKNLVYRIKEKRVVASSFSLRIIPWLWKTGKKLWNFFCELFFSMKMHRFGWTVIVGLILENLLIFFLLLIEDTRWLAALILFPVNPIVLLVLGVKFLKELEEIREAGARMAAGDLNTRINTDAYLPQLKDYAEDLNSIGEGIQVAVNERMKSEHFQTELITNVSHDIKTPLTSIINYVDLLQKTEITDSDARTYLEVLSRQSGKLKKLIEDLIEASKASTGKLTVNAENLDAAVALEQVVGEFGEKLEQKEIRLVVSVPEHPVMIQADSRHLWRVFDNLLNNICKYALPGTRAYINIQEADEHVSIVFRNISRDQLNISGEELLQRFVRADSSRHTEGNGLGLAISQSLMELMGGELQLTVDGDLFKVELKF